MALVATGADKIGARWRCTPIGSYIVICTRYNVKYRVAHKNSDVCIIVTVHFNGVLDRFC